MELSPKQQTVEKIKNAKRILVLGSKNICGDHLGSLLALTGALSSLDKKIESIVSGSIPKKYSYLPGLNEIKPKLEVIDGKVIKVDTSRIPVSGMKWKKDDDSLSIILDTDKNIKFEHINIINGQPKPDLIITVDTKSAQELDTTYNKNHELFIDVPVVNIDHHSDNDHFGTVNLVDTSSVSTSEILVSLFEALGIKIDNPTIATNLLTGIIEDTNSFQNKNTTPKSLTVAAQLLAAGAKQQEIISNLYNKKETPVSPKTHQGESNNDLMRIWGELVKKTEVDKDHRFAWTKIQGEKEYVFEAAPELLEKTVGANTFLTICYSNSEAYGKLVGDDAIELSKIFDTDPNQTTTEFKISAEDLNVAEKIILKKIYDFWQESDDTKTEGKEVWEALDQPNSETNKSNEDAIEEALRSIEQTQDEQEKVKGFTSVRDVIDRKKQNLDPREEIDVFEETE